MHQRKIRLARQSDVSNGQQLVDLFNIECFDPVAADPMVEGVL